MPAFVAAFRAAMQAPEHAAWLHYGATSQDIIDTALVLRLRQALLLWEARLTAILRALAALAERHAETPMAARTYGQVATVTSFGAVVAAWGRPLLRLPGRPAGALRADLLRVSLSGAAGTLSAMGGQGRGGARAPRRGAGSRRSGRQLARDRGALAALSRLDGADHRRARQVGRGPDPDEPERDPRGAAAGLRRLLDDAAEAEPGAALAARRDGAHGRSALDGVMQGALIHRQQRDGAAWIAEWMALPQLCLGLGRALQIGEALAAGIAAGAGGDVAAIDDGSGLVFAEALSFALAKTDAPARGAGGGQGALPRRDRTAGTPLPALAHARWPDADLAAAFEPRAILGTAPAEARAFAASAR